MSAIRLQNVSKVFPTQDVQGKKAYFPALLDVSLKIEESSVAVVAGANGSGKSVLMSIIAGLSKQSEGEVWTKSRVGLVFQDADSQILGDTPMEDVCVGLKNAGIKKSLQKEIAQNALKSVHLLEKAYFPAEFLSGGEKRRLAVASVLALGRDILIFDEPYANLDFPAVVDVNRLIKDLHDEKKTIVILTHELEKCLAFCEHFIVLSHGKVVFDGSPKDALNQKLETWSIRNPLTHYDSIEDLVWL